MSAILSTAKWHLYLVDGWHAKQDGHQYILFPPDDGPVVTISSQVLDTPLSEDDINYFNREYISEGHIPSHVVFGEFSGLEFRYVEDDIYYRHSDLARGRLSLSIEYNCKIADRGKHDEAIDRMANSLGVNEGAI